MQNETKSQAIEDIIKNIVSQNGMIVSWRNFCSPVSLYVTEDFRKYAIAAEAYAHTTLDPHAFTIIDHFDAMVKSKIKKGYKVLKYYIHRNGEVYGAFLKDLEVSEEFIQDIQQFYFSYDSEEFKKRIDIYG
jgi:hypothetical protein